MPDLRPSSRRRPHLSGEAGFYPTRKSLSTLHFRLPAKPADRGLSAASFLPVRRSEGRFLPAQPNPVNRFFYPSAKPAIRAGPPLQTNWSVAAGGGFYPPGSPPSTPLVTDFFRSREKVRTDPSSRARGHLMLPWGPADCHNPARSFLGDERLSWPPASQPNCSAA